MKTVHSVGDTVKICEEEIYLSDDVEFLLSLKNQELEIVEVDNRNKDMTYYTCKNQDGIIYGFDFIDADLTR